jgi:TPR repeat protein
LYILARELAMVVPLFLFLLLLVQTTASASNVNTKRDPEKLKKELLDEIYAQVDSTRDQLGDAAAPVAISLSSDELSARFFHKNSETGEDNWETEDTFIQDIAEWLSERLAERRASLYLDGRLFTGAGDTPEEEEGESHGLFSWEEGEGKGRADTIASEDLDLAEGFAADAFDDELAEREHAEGEGIGRDSLVSTDSDAEAEGWIEEENAGANDQEEDTVGDDEGDSNGDALSPEDVADLAWAAQLSGRLERAVALWKRAAALGNVEAHAVLGFHSESRSMRSRGLAQAAGFPAPPSESFAARCQAAFPYYFQAAQLAVQLMLQDADVGVIEDRYLEDEWMFEVVAGDSPDAAQDQLEYLRQLADTDNNAANDLGNAHSLGMWGAKVNHTEAAKWFRASAKRGSSEGLANLGWLYLGGFGGEPENAAVDQAADNLPVGQADMSNAGNGFESGVAGDEAAAADGAQANGDAPVGLAGDTPPNGQTAASSDTGEAVNAATSATETRTKRRRPQTHRAIRLLEKAAAMGNTHALGTFSPLCALLFFPSSILLS